MKVLKTADRPGRGAGRRPRGRGARPKLILLAGVLFGAAAFALNFRRRRSVAATRASKSAADAAERAYTQRQARFGEAMEVAENHAEGHEILTRHLERGI